MPKLKHLTLLLCCSAILNFSAFAQDTPDTQESLLTTHPALKNLKKIYIIVRPESTEHIQFWKEIEQNVAARLETAGLKIAPGVQLGAGEKDHDIPEIRLNLEILEFQDSNIAVIRSQLSFAAKVFLPDKKTAFKANVWQTEPVLKAVEKNIELQASQALIYSQLDTFIRQYQYSNPAEIASPPDQPAPETAATPATPAAITAPLLVAAQTDSAATYVASKSSPVFHKSDCSSAARIIAKNRLTYSSRQQAITDGKRPCKICKP